MLDWIYTILLSAAMIIVYIAIKGSKKESEECSNCLEKMFGNGGNCVRCNKNPYNRNVFKTFKEVWKS